MQICQLYAVRVPHVQRADFTHAHALRLRQVAASRVGAVGHDAAQAAHFKRLGTALAARAIERGLVGRTRLTGGRGAEAGDADVALLPQLPPQLLRTSQ